MKLELVSLDPSDRIQISSGTFATKTASPSELIFLQNSKDALCV